MNPIGAASFAPRQQVSFAGRKKETEIPKDIKDQLDKMPPGFLEHWRKEQERKKEQEYPAQIPLYDELPLPPPPQRKPEVDEPSEKRGVIIINPDGTTDEDEAPKKERGRIEFYF